MSKLYRTESKYNRVWKEIRTLAIVLFVALLLILSLKSRMEALHPEGEYGRIKEEPASYEQTYEEESSSSLASSSSPSVDLSAIPEYSGTPTYVLNGNKPEFTEEEYRRGEHEFIQLAELDYLGRCGSCMASLSKDMLDKAGERRDISQYTPSGWRQASYPDLIEEEGSWLYHRSHLIGHMFAGQDPAVDGPKNLVTASTYCNKQAMLPYELAVQNWLIRKANGGRVLYRVTPIFSGNELVARGIHIEAADVPTQGQEFHINVYCYNVQPGIEIDYMTGRSWKS